MGNLITNFVSGTLSSGIGNSDTSIPSSGFANLPVVTGSDVLKLVLDPFGEDGAPEIVYVTGHTASATTVTGVLRGQDTSDNSGTARSHASGTLVIHAPVASDWRLALAGLDAVKNAPGTNLATAAPIGLTAGGANSTGVATSVSKSDHRHALSAGSPVASAPGDAQAAGVSSDIARSDHKHAREAWALTADLADIATAKTQGVATSVARGDHTHKIGNGAINLSAMFAAGVVDANAIATDAVGAAELGVAVAMANMVSEAGISYTPTLGSVTLGTGGTKYGRYFKFGRLVVGVAGFTLGTGGDVTGDLTVGLPFTVENASGADWIIAARALVAGGVRASGVGVCLGGNNYGSNFATLGAGSWNASSPGDWISGAGARFIFLFEAVT